MEETNGTMLVTVEPGGSSTAQEQHLVDVNPDDAQLISRLLLGLAFIGGGELLSRLRSAQQRLDASGELAEGDVIPSDETMTDVLAYLGIGMIMRGQKRLSRTINWGLHLSMNTASWALGSFSRVTDNPLGRPFRNAVDRRIWGLMQEGQAAIQDGRREVFVSRKLAVETVGDVVDEAVQTVAENPELTTAVERVVVGQGSGLTATAMGSARQLGTSADDMAEGIARRLFRRKPRRELPPSPLAGKPLTMYGPGSPAQGEQDDDS